MFLWDGRQVAIQLLFSGVFLLGFIQDSTQRFCVVFTHTHTHTHTHTQTHTRIYMYTCICLYVCVCWKCINYRIERVSNISKDKSMDIFECIFVKICQKGDIFINTILLPNRSSISASHGDFSSSSKFHYSFIDVCLPSVVKPSDNILDTIKMKGAKGKIKNDFLKSQLSKSCLLANKEKKATAPQKNKTLHYIQKMKTNLSIYLSIYLFIYLF